MRLEQLQQFIAVAQNGNFRKASRELGISQPALTRSIQSLEEYFNVPLFDRLSSGVVITEYGRTVMAWAEETVSSAGNIRRFLDLLSNASTGKIIIGTGAYFADSVLAAAVGIVIKNNPSLNIKVVRDSWKNAQRKLLDRQIDLFLGWTEENWRSNDISVKTILSDPIVLFTRTHHPLLGKNKMDLGDVLEFPLAGPMIPDEIHQKIDKFRFEYTGVDRPLLAVEFDSYSEVRKIVQLSDCVGGLPESCMLPFFREGSMVRLPVSFPGLKGRTGISHLKDITLLPAARFIIQELTEILQDRLRKMGLNEEKEIQ